MEKIRKGVTTYLFNPTLDDVIWANKTTPMITQYIILQSTSPDDLQKKVNNYLNDGWQPLGGINITNVKMDIQGMISSAGKETLHYTQALVM